MEGYFITGCTTATHEESSRPCAARKSASSLAGRWNLAPPIVVTQVLLRFSLSVQHNTRIGRLELEAPVVFDISRTTESTPLARPSHRTPQLADEAEAVAAYLRAGVNIHLYSTWYQAGGCSAMAADDVEETTVPSLQ